MPTPEALFNIQEGRECINAEIYAWLLGYPGGGLYFYIDGPTEVLRYMGWPMCEGQID